MSHRTAIWSAAALVLLLTLLLGATLLRPAFQSDASGDGQNITLDRSVADDDAYEDEEHDGDHEEEHEDEEDDDD